MRIQGQWDFNTRYVTTLLEEQSKTFMTGEKHGKHSPLINVDGVEVYLDASVVRADKPESPGPTSACAASADRPVSSHPARRVIALTQASIVVAKPCQNTCSVGDRGLDQRRRMWHCKT
jgi:hypothetical protein